jgi:hypothetical protein
MELGPRKKGLHRRGSCFLCGNKDKGSDSRFPKNGVRPIPDFVYCQKKGYGGFGVSLLDSIVPISILLIPRRRFSHLSNCHKETPGIGTLWNLNKEEFAAQSLLILPSSNCSRIGPFYHMGSFEISQYDKRTNEKKKRSDNKKRNSLGL